MTDPTQNLPTITVPVGFGGKTNPYVSDPAPTLLVELASLDRAKEETRVAAFVARAEAEADALIAAAEATASGLHADAAAAVASLLEEARADAAAIIQAAQQEADDVTGVAQATATELDELRRDLESRTSELDSRETDLMSRETELIDRLAAADVEAAEAATVLAAARTEAETFLADARETAEQILEDARREAADAAEALLADARAAAENDPTVAERIAEVESVHRIEVQVLHERELTLLERIAALEARLAAPLEVSEEQADVGRTDTEAPQAGQAGQAAESTGDSLAVDLDAEVPAVTVRPGSRSNGRHTSDPRVPEHAEAGPVASHAPLTEQLSTSAFRSMPESDRRGRRRR